MSPPPLPMEHIWLMVFTYSSMILYSLMITTILSNKRVFRSAYYTLLLSHSAADVLMFLWVEIVMRPRKYNYFGMFSEEMSIFPWLSYSVLMFIRTSAYAGHIPIAYNRFTAFRWPSRQRRIWSRRTTSTWIASIWLSSAFVAFPFSLIYWDDIYFVKLDSGIIQMLANYVYTFDTILILVSISLVISICSFFYIMALKISYTAMKRRRRTAAQRRLLICAVASSFPLVVEFVRAIIQGVANIENNVRLIVFVTEWWFFEMEIIISLQVWVQLIVNTTLRNRMKRVYVGAMDRILCARLYNRFKCSRNTV